LKTLACILSNILKEDKDLELWGSEYLLNKNIKPDKTKTNDITWNI